MKFFLILLVVSLLLRLLMPYIIKWAIKAFVKKTIKNGTFNNAAGPFAPFNQNNQPPQPEGNIKVNYKSKGQQERPKDFPGGEYVDYEEVK